VILPSVEVLARISVSPRYPPLLAEGAHDGGEERVPDQAPKYCGRRRKTPLTWLWGASGGCEHDGVVGGRGTPR
jgi:hypothetical protein